MQKQLHKKAIALLITVFFIMAITVSIGVGLKYLKSANDTMSSELFNLQTSIILDDVLNILKKSPELQKINSAESLAVFLAQTASLPFSSHEVNVEVEIKSARAKVNINKFKTQDKLDTLKLFLEMKNINTEYANMIFDSINGVKEDNSYTTDIFSEKPYLFRDYISSKDQLLEINDAYYKSFHDANLKNVDTLELFYLSKDTNSSVDLNYATALTWELLLSCDSERANMLEVNGAGYTSVDDFDLNDDEKIALNKFQVSFYEPIIDVKIEITQKNLNASIRFEYNIISKKGSNFVYEV